MLINCHVLPCTIQIGHYPQPSGRGGIGQSYHSRQTRQRRRNRHGMRGVLRQDLLLPYASIPVAMILLQNAVYGFAIPLLSFVDVHDLPWYNQCMNINELTNDEAREAMREAIDEIGLEGAVSLTWHLLDKQAEKVTSDIAGDKAKTRAELTVMRMMLDKLESYYQEEMDIANGGDEPVYKA